MPYIDIPAITKLVDWFETVSWRQRFLFLLIINFLGYVGFLWYYEKQIYDVSVMHNHRVDSICVFYTEKLEDCNSSSKKDLQSVLVVLQKALKDQQEQHIESERLRLETEKIKLKR